MPNRMLIALAVLGLAALPTSIAAQIVVSANDGSAVLVDGVNVVPSPPGTDTVTILDASQTPPRVIAELEAPSSVIGPPQNVAISPDNRLAVVSSSTKVDPADPTRTIPDDTLTVIDIGAGTPAVVGTATAGPMASGLSFTPDGRLLLVANRGNGTVSVFAVSGQTLTPAGTIDFEAPASGPSHVAVTPDGRRALVSRDGDSFVSVLAIEGQQVTYDGENLAAGLKPYGMAITPDGHYALVANVGGGATGSVDTVAIIDLTLEPARTVNYATVGVTAEGIALSPDGRHAAVTVMNGSNAAPDSPLFNDFGRLRVFAFEAGALRPVAEARVGHWCQGVVWTNTSTVLAQCPTEREIQVFTFDGAALTPAGAIPIDGAPVGIAAGTQ